jgi:AcrR family transcriptional regulator
MRKRQQAINRQARGRPTREDAAAIEANLLDVARTLFVQKGYSNMTLDELAVVLGSSKHTIYRRFNGKEAIFDAVVERDIQQFRAELLTSRSQKSPLKGLRACSRCYYEFGINGNYAALYLFIVAESTVSIEMRQKLTRWSSISLEPMLEAVRTAQASGDLTNESPLELLNVLIDLLDGAASRVRSNRKQPEGKEQRLIEKLFQDRWALFLKLFATNPRRHSRLVHHNTSSSTLTRVDF